MNLKIENNKQSTIKNIYDTIYFINIGNTNLASFDSNELDGDHAVRQNPGNTISPGFNPSPNGERTPNECLISYLGRVLPKQGDC